MMMSFRYYLSIFLHRFPWFLLVAGGISGAAVTVALQLPPSYVSQTQIIVESAQIPGELAESTVLISAQEQLQIFETRLLTRTNLLAIARNTQVLDDSGSMSPDQIVTAMRARTKIKSSSGHNQATFMTLSFEASNPRRAAAVLNEYLSLILREDAEFRAERAGQTQEFFEQEVARLGEELSNQSAKILAFKNEHANALPESMEYRRGQQLRVQEQLLLVERDLAELNEQRERLVQIYETTGRIDTSVERTPLQAQLDSLQAELSGALVVYSENNPKVRLLRSQIDQISQQINRQSDAPDTGSEAVDPAQAMFEFQLTEIGARVEQMESRRGQLLAQLEELTESIEQTPANAIALSALERDYENVQGQYNQAVDRLARAATGERIETLSRGQRISVVEQPTPPSVPSKPNRKLIAGGGSFVGIMAGLALVVALEILNNTVRRPSDLVSGLGVTPIATIPYLRSRKQKLWRRLSVVLMTLLIMIAIPLILAAIHIYYLPLELIAERVMDKLRIR